MQAYLYCVRRLQLWHAGVRCGMWDLSSLTGDQTGVPCIGNQILNLWITREVPVVTFSFFFKEKIREMSWGSQVVLVVKNPPINAGGIIGKIPWRRTRQPTSVFSPGESHGQRNLVGYSP